MIEKIKEDTKIKMQKSLDSLMVVFGRIRAGRASPGILEGVKVSYYGSEVPLSQVANVTVEDARTLSIRAWERILVPEIEKAILKSDLGLNPSTAGDVIRITLSALTEETRKGFVKQARQEAEIARQSVRHVRRESLLSMKELEKSKEISEDELHRVSDDIQKITDSFIASVDKVLVVKEEDLMGG